MFDTHIRIRRSYMAVFDLDLNTEMVIHWEQLTRLIRDAMHYTCIKRQNNQDVWYHEPDFMLNGYMFSSPMQEHRKFSF